MHYDISLYGHLTVDHVFHDFEESVTLGAMANVWNALLNINSDISVKLNPVAIGTAVVLVNKEKGIRVGRGNLNLKNRKPQISKSNWHHVMYLNQLKDPSFIDEIEDGIISADITAGPMNIEEWLPKLDYLFISDEDLFMDIDELGKLVKGHVILHYPSGSYVTDGAKSFESLTETVEGLDVLGAGDMFAASFILQNITTNDKIQDVVDYSHATTTKLLLEKNRKSI